MSGGSVANKPISHHGSTRIVMVGDRGTGKSSLIAAAATNEFPESVPSVLVPTSFLAGYYPNDLPITVIDTAFSLEAKAELEDEFKGADVVVVTYACNQPETLDHIWNYWLPEIRRLKVKVPVIVVGCKYDLYDKQYSLSSPESLDRLETKMAPQSQQFKEIEVCIECSAANFIQVHEVFYYAQKAVLHPTAPLFAQESQTLKPRCISAMTEIFNLCDHDMDGVLNDNELKEFHIKCFGVPIQPAEIMGVKRVLQEKIPEGVNDGGITLTGFLFLLALSIEIGRLDTTWTVLRRFGYNDDLEVETDNLPDLSTMAPDHQDGTLQDSELDDQLYSIAPQSPRDEASCNNCMDRTKSRDSRLSELLFQLERLKLLNENKTKDDERERALANREKAIFERESAMTMRLEVELERLKQQLRLRGVRREGTGQTSPRGHKSAGCPSYFERGNEFCEGERLPSGVPGQKSAGRLARTHYSS